MSRLPYRARYSRPLVPEVIADILPAKAAAVEAFGDLPGVTLFPEEKTFIAKAVDKRRREFTTARACARAALATLGLPPAPIVPGLRGAPQWPAGVVGSITHCAGYCACALARTADLAAIGIDAEPHDALPGGVLDVIATASERARLSQYTTLMPGTCWDRLLFSAKESVYKAWFPLTRRWLDFDQAEITIEPTAGTFTAHLLTTGPALNGRELKDFTGRWLARDGYIVTAIAVPT